MTLNVLVFVLRVVFFHLIVYIVTRYMYNAVRRDFALSASFVLQRFDGSEVTTREDKGWTRGGWQRGLEPSLHDRPS